MSLGPRIINEIAGAHILEPLQAVLLHHSLLIYVEEGLVLWHVALAAWEEGAWIHEVEGLVLFRDQVGLTTHDLPVVRRHICEVDLLQ